MNSARRTKHISKTSLVFIPLMLFPVAMLAGCGDSSAPTLVTEGMSKEEVDAMGEAMNKQYEQEMAEGDPEAEQALPPTEEERRMNQS